MDNTALERFENKVNLFRATRLQKLSKMPGKYIYTLALAAAANLRKGGIKTKATLLTGDQMTVVFPEEVSVALCRYGFYEEGGTRSLLGQLQAGMTFLDVGAHFGYYTLLASHLVGNKGQVHAFEPTPSTFRVLEANVKGNPNIRIHQIALSSVSGQATLSDCGVKFSQRNSLHQPRLSQPAWSRLTPVPEQVQTTTIDQYASRAGAAPDFIKIDAEGSGYEVLLGADQTLRKMRPIITLEVGDSSLDGYPRSREPVQFLIERGYQPYEFRQGRFLKHAPRDSYQWDNLMFVPA
jgi:FkbM family methyltransferase